MNHRIIEVGKDLWRSPHPTPPCSQEDQLEQIAHGHVQLGFDGL